MLKTIETTKLTGKLLEVFQRQKGRCNHVGCRIRGIYNLTQDHEIPVSVCKFHGLPRSFYESVNNKQLLCPEHHINKDRKNNMRLAKLKRRAELLSKIKEIKNVLT